MYIKKLALWPLNQEYMQRGRTVHQTAAYVGVHPSTAFRWRHRVLNGLRLFDTESLRGTIELDSTWFMQSEKGRRVKGRPPRSRRSGDPWPEADTGANVVIACDRLGGTVTGVAAPSNSRVVSAESLERVLGSRVQPESIILARYVPRNPPAAFAERIRGVMIPARATQGIPTREFETLDVVSGYRFRLHRWIKRFRGVATRYLSNYLVWHRFVDAGLRRGFAETAFHWPLGPLPFERVDTG